MWIFSGSMLSANTSKKSFQEEYGENSKTIFYMVSKMSKHRTLSTKNKYYIPKETFLMVIHYCKQYPMWVTELGITLDQSKAIRYDVDRVQSSNDYDPTAEPAIKRAEIARKKELVDSVAKYVAGGMYKWLILGVCYDMPYYALKQKGIPCGKDMYYDKRRRFYFEMAARL